MRNKKSFTSDQRGFVSLVVALTLIIILALITVGFSQLSRREQKQALDKQLSIQAKYAAETAINDIYAAVKAKQIDVNINPDQCIDLNTDVTTPISPDINSGSGVKYTCVLVDLKPPSIEYSNLSAGSDRTAGPFSTENALSTLTIKWGSNNSRNSNFPPSINTNFQKFTNWGTQSWPPVLQVSITSLAGGADRNAMISNTLTAYLYPASSGTNTHPYFNGIANGAANGPILSGNCNVAGGNYPCSTTITGFTSPGPYLIHIVGYYDDSNIFINGKDSANNPVKFVNGQVQIDATAKAQNVLKRLRVRLPIEPGADAPNFAIEAQSVCKRFATAPYDDRYNPVGTGFDSGTSPSCVISP